MNLEIKSKHQVGRMLQRRVFGDAVIQYKKKLPGCSVACSELLNWKLSKFFTTAWSFTTSLSLSANESGLAAKVTNCFLDNFLKSKYYQCNEFRNKINTSKWKKCYKG